MKKIVLSSAVILAVGAGALFLYPKDTKVLSHQRMARIEGDCPESREGCDSLTQAGDYCICVTRAESIDGETADLAPGRQRNMYLCDRPNNEEGNAQGPAIRYLPPRGQVPRDCVLVAEGVGKFAGVGMRTIPSGIEAAMCKALCPDGFDCDRHNPIHPSSWGRFPWCARAEGCEKYCVVPGVE